ncbi:type IV pilus biogenesis protein PilM [Rossellomorea marisflavi]|uniref:type IV pilus biogenesis protein PilM n=1 Tax=Rossellomorea marisflavi TaxID=189381 RepID=UPI001EE3854F|nr:pilus assembly protein PilM [Rossellomorea marisflavi]UKS64202.1 pilus assembly protein PilM [Rossellomorea marisflavi]
MLSNLFVKKKNRISLVISNDWVRYAEVKSTSPLYIQRHGEKRLPEGTISNGKILEPAILRSFMEQCVEEWGIARQHVQFLVPNTQMIVRRVMIPADVQDDEVESHLFMELGTSIHLPFEHPLYDAVVAGMKDGKKEVILIAAEEKTVLDYQDLLELSSLKPVAADISPLALYRYLHLLQLTDGNDHEMVLFFHEGSIAVSVFHRHQPVFFRNISLSGNSDVMDPIQSDEILKEVEKVISFYRYTLHDDGTMITKLFVGGEHILSESYQTMLADRLEVPSRYIASEAKSAHTGEPVPARFLLPVGLGLKEVR